MGLLDDYQIDLNEVEANTFDVPDGIYSYMVGDQDIQQGTKKDPEQDYLRIHYILDDDNKQYKYTEFLKLPKDTSNLTDDAKQQLGRIKSRVMALGFSEEGAGSVETDDLIGLSGTLQLVTSKGKTGGTFQNVRNMRPDDAAGENLGGAAFIPAPTTIAETEPAPEPKKRATRARKAPVQAVIVEEAPVVAEAVEEVGEPAAAPEGVEADTDLKARVAARRAARQAQANTAGTRTNPFSNPQ